MRYRIEVSATPTSAAIKSQSVDVATQSTVSCSFHFRSPFPETGTNVVITRP
jgi:hypothetical protein